jgi:glycine dehydrogenase
MAGMRVVVVACDKHGNIDMTTSGQGGAHKDRLSAAMVTYPSTHGVFEEESRSSAPSSTTTGGWSISTART